MSFSWPGSPASLQPAKVKSVPGDANRDGREDILLLVGGEVDAPRVERLHGPADSAGFKRVPIWIAPKFDAHPRRAGRGSVRPTLDHDGQTDLVLFSEHPRWHAHPRPEDPLLDSMRAGSTSPSRSSSTTCAVLSAARPRLLRAPGRPLSASLPVPPGRLVAADADLGADSVRAAGAAGVARPAGASRPRRHSGAGRRARPRDRPDWTRRAGREPRGAR